MPPEGPQIKCCASSSEWTGKAQPGRCRKIASAGRRSFEGPCARDFEIPFRAWLSSEQRKTVVPREERHHRFQFTTSREEERMPSTFGSEDPDRVTVTPGRRRGATVLFGAPREEERASDPVWQGARSGTCSPEFRQLSKAAWYATRRISDLFIPRSCR